MAKVLSKEEWRRRRRLYAYIKLALAAVLAILILLVVVLGLLKIVRNLFSRDQTPATSTLTMKQELNITEYFLTKNIYSRPGNELKSVKGIVIHYVADAGSTAAENRNYYESLKGGEGGAESCHFIVDLDGTIVQCIPLSEVACASGERNEDTIAIAFCHPKIDGIPADATYQSLIELTAYLCEQYGLGKDAVLRHSDLGEQNCPKYYAEQEGKWAAFLAEVDTMLAQKKK